MRTDSRRKAKRAKSALAPEPTPAVEPVVEPVVEPATSTERLTLPLREDGTIDLDAMRARTKEKLRTAVADDRLRDGLGLGGGSAPTDDPRARAIFEQAVSVLYVSLSRAVQYGALRRGASVAQVRAIGLDADEIAGLSTVTLPVIEKWMPDSFTWQEEIALVLALSGVAMAKMAAYEQAGAQAQPHPEAATPAS
jgi:hypothetical protein